MRCESNLTSNVQNYIADTLAKKVQEAQSSWELSDVARDIRCYLCDQSSLSTPDFVIRRFLQAKQSSVLPADIDIPNLLTKKDAMNVPWPEDVLDLISSRLAKQSKAKGTKLDKKAWLAYLSGKRNPQNREMVFRIAFSIDMDVDTTIDLLLASDFEPYSARYPLDLICLFCQRVPGKYNWDEVLSMLEDFTKRRGSSSVANNTPTEGKTQQIITSLDAIFAQNLPEADSKRTLVDFMVDNSSEFVGYTKTVERACRDEDGKIIKDEKEITYRDEGGSIITKKKLVTRTEKKSETHYLEGFSLSRMNCFMRLAEYLGILFPYYSWGREKEPDKNAKHAELKDWGSDGVFIIPLDHEENGMPKLQSLVRCMFFNCNADIFPKKESPKKGSNAKTITTVKEPKSSLSKEDEFNEVMRKLLQNYEAHMTAVSKLREYLIDLQGEKEEAQDGGKDDFVAFFSRQDALFFIYFFIVGYRNLLSQYYNPDWADYAMPKPGTNGRRSIGNFLTPKEAKKLIEKMCMSGNTFDDAMVEVISNIEYIFYDLNDDDTTATRFDYLGQCFNLILAQMDYMNLYLPARFDRFVMLSLLAEDPAELTPLIMCQTQLDGYERST